MKKLLLMLLVIVLALPSIASAVESSGKPVLVPESEADGGGGPVPRAWSSNQSFFVRSHICRNTAVFTILCGPDPLVDIGAAFNGVHRVWFPVNEPSTVYFFALDSEGTVIRFSSGNFNVSGNTYINFFFMFPPIPDGLYKFLGVVVGAVSGITFSNYYQFRVGGNPSGGCCP